MQTQPTNLTSTPLVRHDLYGSPHKGLRHFMTETLMRTGSLDVDDLESATATLDQLRRLVRAMAHHLKLEDRFVLPAIEACRPGATASNVHDHRHHEQSFDALTDLAGALERAITARASDRRRIATRLYVELSRFVADNLIHMLTEETENNAILWAEYSDDELRVLQGRIVASETPEELGLGLRWLVQALSPDERAVLVVGARPNVPPAVFDHLLGFIRTALSPTDWTKLETALAA